MYSKLKANIKNPTNINIKNFLGLSKAKIKKMNDIPPKMTKGALWLRKDCKVVISPLGIDE